MNNRLTRWQERMTKSVMYSGAFCLLCFVSFFGTLLVPPHFGYEIEWVVPVALLVGAAASAVIFMFALVLEVCLGELEKFVETAWKQSEIYEEIHNRRILIGVLAVISVALTIAGVVYDFLPVALLYDVYFGVMSIFSVVIIVIGRRRLRWHHQRVQG